MKEVKLTKGKVSLVDDDDFGRVSKFKWHANWNNYNWYAKRSFTGGRQESLHHFIFGVGNGVMLDHINGESLDNRKSNLRICNKMQNAGNSRKRIDGCSSKYKGVGWNKRTHRWIVRIRMGGERKYIGSFLNEDDAGRAYDAEASKYFGVFSRPNFRRA
jgi:hypothetical protein